jgi:exopolysaccharide biosynthesis WecB/TagA/CpsF family protein
MSVRRLLVVQLADIGDLVLSTPALMALREALPEAHITLLTTPHSAPIVRDSGWVDDIITADRRLFGLGSPLKAAADFVRLLARLRRGAFDAILYFHHFTTRVGALKYALLAYATTSPRRIGLENGKGFFLTERLPDGGFGANHQAQYWLDLAVLLGADPKPRSSAVAVSQADRTWAATHLPPVGQGKPRVVIHAGSGGDSYARRWSPEGFAAVADRLSQERGAEIVLVGGGKDDTGAVKALLHTPAIDLSGKTTLNQLAAVLRTADCFIGADSGVMHMACAAQVPVVAIFGPSNHEAWGAWTPESPSIILRSAPECSPCSYIDHTTGQREGCAARTCMTMITANQVYTAAAKLLDKEISIGQPRVVGARQASPAKILQRHKYVSILGLPVSAITYEGWLDLIEQWITHEPERVHHVCTINPEFAMIAQNDVNFANILRRANLTVPDGVGMVWAARRLGKMLPERVTGSDGVPKIAERAAQKGWKLFFLGAVEGVAQQAADVLQNRYPGVQIVGVYSGSPSPQEEAAIVERVNASGADILLVAYGAPEQDKWIARNTPCLRVTMAMGVGGSFDFIAGVIPRAPAAMQRMGLEWLYRLYLQPWRIKRMMRLPRFVIAVLLRGEQ